jgi:hypothetical protein
MASTGYTQNYNQNQEEKTSTGYYRSVSTKPWVGFYLQSAKLLVQLLVKPLAEPLEKPLVKPLAKPLVKPLAKPLESPLVKPLGKLLKESVHQPGRLARSDCTY